MVFETFWTFNQLWFSIHSKHLINYGFRYILDIFSNMVFDTFQTFNQIWFLIHSGHLIKYGFRYILDIKSNMVSYIT